jgi:hypothetical protein
LQERLAQSLTSRLGGLTWDGIARMASAADEVERTLGRPRPTEPRVESLEVAVARLAAGEELSRRELLLCAAGATTEFPRGDSTTRLIDHQNWVDALRQQARPVLQDARRGRRLAENLAWAVVASATIPSGPCRVALTELGEDAVAWARERTDEGSASPSSEAIVSLAGLLTRLDTAQFHGYLDNGDESVWRPLTDLVAPTTTWVRSQAFLDALAIALTRSDDAVQAAADLQLELLRQHPLIVDEALGMILRRWTGIRGRPEHQALRDLAVKRWNSPLASNRIEDWRQRAGEPARAMVATWLTRGAMEIFFQLAGSGSDEDRLIFWRRYAQDVDAFTFYLSVDDRARLRGMRDRIGPLADDRQVFRSLGHRTTSAFVMGLGPYNVVEFSETSNATYVYPRGRMPASFQRTSASLEGLKVLAMASLRLTHRSPWQDKFRREIGDLTGVWPRS